MKRPYFQKFIASAVLIGAVLGTATAAHARPDVFVSIGLPGLPGLPILVPPPLPRLIVRNEPVYVQPRPVYQAPPVVVYERPWQPAYRYDAERGRDWRHHEWQHRGRGHDQDRDGVPNRYDGDRDGDGVPNRYDRQPDNRYRR